MQSRVSEQRERAGTGKRQERQTGNESIKNWGN